MMQSWEASSTQEDQSITRKTPRIRDAEQGRNAFIQNKGKAHGKEITRNGCWWKFISLKKRSQIFEDLSCHHLKPGWTSLGTWCANSTSISKTNELKWEQVLKKPDDLVKKMKNLSWEVPLLYSLLREKLEIIWLIQHSHWKAERGWGSSLSIHWTNKHQGRKRDTAAIYAGIKSKELQEYQK